MKFSSNTSELPTKEPPHMERCRTAEQWEQLRTAHITRRPTLPPSHALSSTIRVHCSTDSNNALATMHAFRCLHVRRRRSYCRVACLHHCHCDRREAKIPRLFFQHQHSVTRSTKNNTHITNQQTINKNTRQSRQETSFSQLVFFAKNPSKQRKPHNANLSSE